MDQFILWVEKEQKELQLGTMQTIISQRVLNQLTKKKEQQSMTVRIMRCKYKLYFITNLCAGSDMIFSIIQFKDKIKLQIPKIMELFKDNLHDLNKIDDALHLMQFMLQLSGSGYMKRCDPDPDHYSNFGSKDAQRPKNVVMCPDNQQIASSEGFLTFVLPQSPGAAFK